MLSLGTPTRSIASFLGHTLPLNLPFKGNPPFDPSTTKLTDLCCLPSNETVTSAFHVEQYLAQIENHKDKGTLTITLTAPKADLTEQAHCLDGERMDGYIPDAKHGIPVLIGNTQQTEPENDAPLLNPLIKTGMIPTGRTSPPLINTNNDSHQIPTEIPPQHSSSPPPKKKPHHTP